MSSIKNEEAKEELKYQSEFSCRQSQYLDESYTDYKPYYVTQVPKTNEAIDTHNVPHPSINKRKGIKLSISILKLTKILD